MRKVELCAEWEPISDAQSRLIKTNKLKKSAFTFSRVAHKIQKKLRDDIVRFKQSGSGLRRGMVPIFSEEEEVKTRLDILHTFALRQTQTRATITRKCATLQVGRTHLSDDSLHVEKTLLDESALQDLRRTFTTKQEGTEGGRLLRARAGTSACERERGI